jgi:DNA-binding XRE family transcriptional regulator
MDQGENGSAVGNGSAAAAEDKVAAESGEMDLAKPPHMASLKKTGPNPAHKRTETIAENVMQLAMVGLTQEQMGKILGIAPMTLRKYYSDEIDNSKNRMNGQIAMGLARRALDGDTISSIFWLKAQAGWRDQHVKIDQSVQVVDTAKHRLLDMLGTARPALIDNQNKP